MQEIRNLDDELTNYINDYSDFSNDSTWTSFAWRTKVSVIKKAIVLQICNGMVFDEKIASFCRWAFKYLMWCKMNLFGENADSKFVTEEIVGKRGNQSPLKYMEQIFEASEFASRVAIMGLKTDSNQLLRNDICRGVIEKTESNKYIINESFYNKFNAKK
ncbi:MAG: hypothetical protein HUJ63_08735 [Enterococcus sp.]|nr:hypothetical protein [Enterococcus sp.]